MKPRQVISLAADMLAGKPVKVRSPKWDGVRKQHISEHPSCEVCGYDKGIEAHHLQSFHEHPELELEPGNILSLGKKCPTGNHHLLFGHLGDYASININCVQDSKTWLQKIKTRP